ncbi:hypothetical protein DPEC_G00155320 [Dallia pectoralis]|uniref:Uncharacterized protein n=1 Tax=Dallia pectoralis TaxID=75939 RepID=A0ACC2GKW6_DALPE|nr:hypothetical protein DPEC_G00155320 [Dallia pectoralis]
MSAEEREEAGFWQGRASKSQAALHRTSPVAPPTRLVCRPHRWRLEAALERINCQIDRERYGQGPLAD